MGRIIVAAVAVLVGTGCAASAEPIDLAVMTALLALRAMSERLTPSPGGRELG